MSSSRWIDSQTAARMSLAEIGALLVRHRLLEPTEIEHMSLREMRMMLTYLAGVRTDTGKPDSPRAEG